MLQLPTVPNPPARRWALSAAADNACVQFDGIVLPGRTLSFEAHAGDIVHLAGGTPMTQLRVLAIASAFSFGGPGRCRLFGLDVKTLSPEQRLQLRRHQIGRVLQTDELPADLPLLAGVAQPALHSGLSAREALHRAAEELDAIGLVEQQSLPPAALEPGILRLALLARALVARPRLLLLERPEIGLASGSHTGLALALTSAAEAGCCVLITSSHPQLAALAQQRVSLDAMARPERLS